MGIMKKLNSKGSSPLHIVLILVIVGLIAGVGYYVYNSQKKTNTALDNAAKSQADPQKSEKKEEITEEAENTTQKYLEIKEWGIKFKLTENIEDAYYDGIKATSMEAFSLRVHSLDSEPDCKTGSQSIVTIFKVDKDTPDDRLPDQKYSETNATQGKLIANDFYFMGGAQYTCAQNANNQDLLNKVRKEFIEASATIERM